MLLRFILYGLLGWCAEILWTALYDLATGERRVPGEGGGRVKTSRAERFYLTGRTYLWMLPIYGGGGLLFERVYDRIQHWPWELRGAIYVVGILAIEALAGRLLKAAIGRCPWDYSYARANVGGLIRLDYVPVWFVFGMALERVQTAVRLLEPALKAALFR